ncbi:MAG: hypothetical protein R6W67_01065 [Bacteroidales bacterium]
MKRYSLESRENSRLVKIMQILFGIACIFTAGWWAVYMLKALESGNYWIATLFMFFFGAFQIYSGLGHASKYIIIGSDTLTIRKTAIGKKQVVTYGEIERIEILPLSVSLILRSGSKLTINFAVTLAGDIDHIKDAIADFGRNNNIITEDKREV